MKFIYALINMLAEMAPYLLLGFLVAGLLYAFVPAQFYRRHLSKPGAWAVIKAALIGVPLPLCSCGVLPTAVSLRRNGASRGASTSFLIATPQTGLDSIFATYSLLGLAFAIIRPVAALVTAFIGGMLVNREERAQSHEDCAEEVDTIDAPKSDTLSRKIVDALRYGFVDMVQNIGKWLVIGLVIAAAITVFVPDGFFTYFAKYPLLAMVAVVIVAVPMYVCSTGSIPIALSLMMKGLTPGAAFVLLIAREAGGRNISGYYSHRLDSHRTLHRLYDAQQLVCDLGYGRHNGPLSSRCGTFPGDMLGDTRRTAHLCDDQAPFTLRGLRLLMRPRSWPRTRASTWTRSWTRT